MWAQHLWLIIDLFLLASAAFALWKGSPAERLAAAAVIINVVVAECGRAVAPSADSVIRLFNDGVAAVALLAITIRYGAPWMGGVMLLFAAQFSLHSYYLVIERPQDDLHALINNLDWSGISWCLIIGTVVAWRQRVRAARPAGQAAP